MERGGGSASLYSYSGIQVSLDTQHTVGMKWTLMLKVNRNSNVTLFTFTFMHSAEAFILSDFAFKVAYTHFISSLNP